LGGGFPCYAYKLAHGRLKQRYLANPHTALKEQSEATIDEYERQRTDPFYPRFWPKRLAELQRGIDSPDYQTYIRRKSMGIFVCDMGELFGYWLPERWIHEVLETIADDSNSVHRFYLLTKQPQNLAKFSPFPSNCWVGVTVTNQAMYDGAVYHLNNIQAKVKYISLEPLLSDIYLPNYKDVDWVIIGALTGTKYKLLEISQLWNIKNKCQGLKLMPYGKIWTLQPKIEWVEEIVRACDKAGIPVFLKDSLKPLIGRTTAVYKMVPDVTLQVRDAANKFALRQDLPE